LLETVVRRERTAKEGKGVQKTNGMSIVVKDWSETMATTAATAVGEWREEGQPWRRS
jgi:hypothetical protein